jgi:hypothetical protein
VRAHSFSYSSSLAYLKRGGGGGRGGGRVFHLYFVFEMNVDFFFIQTDERLDIKAKEGFWWSLKD